MQRQSAIPITGTGRGAAFLPLLAVLALGACDSAHKTVNAAAEPPLETAAASAPAAVMQKGMYFKPDLAAFAVHNEYDADGDGDGINETHVRRYISETGDTAFSMTTGERLWAWSLDTRDDDDSDIHANYVIRDSNCDGVFDERYTLSAQYHVPGCLAQGQALAAPQGG